MKKIHVCSLEDALVFVPTVPTYAIRIFSTNQEDSRLVDSPNWVHVAKYVFDEETEREYRSILDEKGVPELPTTLFTLETARTVLTDFVPYEDKCEEVLVHCVGGHCRSKGIGRAVNQIFRMGNPLKTFFNIDGKMNCPHFYRIMLEEAKRMGIY